MAPCVGTLIVAKYICFRATVPRIMEFVDYEREAVTPVVAMVITHIPSLW